MHQQRARPACAPQAKGRAQRAQVQFAAVGSGRETRGLSFMDMCAFLKAGGPRPILKA